MKFDKSIKTIFQNFIAAVTLVQLVLGIIWLVNGAISGKASVAGIIYFAAFLVLAVVYYLAGSKEVGIIVLYIISMPLVIHGLTSKEHIIGMPKAPAGSIEQLAVQRFAWPDLNGMREIEEYTEWPDGLLVGASSDPKFLWTDMFPKIESHLGAAELKRLCKQSVSNGLANNKRGILLDMAAEGGAYLFSPVTVVSGMILGNAGRTGADFDEFTEGYPKLFRFYFLFGCFSFAVIFILGVIANIACHVKIKPVKPILLLIVIVLYNLFFTVRGFDYKNSVYIIAIWIYILTASLRRENAGN